jgi:aspartyl-tRNA synthetase
LHPCLPVSPPLGQDPEAAAKKKADKEAKKAAKAAEKAAKEAAKEAAKVRAARPPRRSPPPARPAARPPHTHRLRPPPGAPPQVAEAARKLASLTQPDPDDPLKAQYGDTPLVQSQAVTGRVWTPVSSLAAALEGQAVTVRGRVHTVRGKGRSAFLVVRDDAATAQAVLFVDDATVSKGMVKYASNLPRESIVDVEGVVCRPQEPIEACSQSEVELHVTAVRCVSRAGALPFDIADAARGAAAVAAGAARGEQFVTVGQDTRLDNRVVDLRTPANHAIFRVQSAVGQLFRESLHARGFVEIHTPKLLGGASEGGAAVFRLDYMGRPACLAQSPQFYKQMAVCGDLPRVFEIGPVFRAEDSNTHRHLCEFTGLDMEMAIHESYHEVLDVLDDLFVHMFRGLNERCARELGVVGEQFPFRPLRFLPKTLRLTFAEGVEMLREAGHEVSGAGACLGGAVAGGAASPRRFATQPPPHPSPFLLPHCAAPPPNSLPRWTPTATSAPRPSACWAAWWPTSTPPTFTSCTATPPRRAPSTPCPRSTTPPTPAPSTSSSAGRRSSAGRSACTTPRCSRSAPPPRASRSTPSSPTWTPSSTAPRRTAGRAWGWSGW